VEVLIITYENLSARPIKECQTNFVFVFIGGVLKFIEITCKKKGKGLPQQAEVAVRGSG